MIDPNKLILVAGATGGVGQQIVKQLRAQRAQVRLLVRDAARARETFGPYVSLTIGDVREPRTLRPVFEDVRIVICAIGTRTPVGDNRPELIDYEGVANLIREARDERVDHFVLVSSIAVTRPNHPLNQFGQVLNWKLAGEEVLRSSGLTYTIVRPGGLTDEPGGQNSIIFDQGDRLSGRISRADVAAVCLAALDQPAARQATFEIVNGDDMPRGSWTDKFALLEPDAVAVD